ncbi:hypothetical protein VMCG_05249 [Cytospora schulzeri]|uniref:Uncharacterized protein n=1 Tax=Cytospora schulzeri TaxID=448051 RepID=A0A423WRC3_9PEZI|nr:hypothetical protein VMCG_05249 [Valsa malicola]
MVSRKPQGDLEIHVPKSYNSERPALRFSQVSFDTDLSEHPLASRLPSATDGPSIQTGGEEFRDLNTGDKLPSTIEDYTYSDEPPLALHVWSFKDAMIVSLNFPHALTDAIGLTALVKNWCKVLAGREEDVDALEEDDPFDSIGASGDKDDAGEKYVLSDLKLKGCRFLQFALNFTLQVIFGPKMETRLIFLPQKSLRALRQRALDDLQHDDPKQTDTSDSAYAKPYISDGDILSAWGARMIDLGLGKRKRALTVMNVFDMRSRLGSLFDHSTAYVQNAICVLFFGFDANPKPDPTHRNIFSIRGKDLSGNYWIMGMLSKTTWAHIEQELIKL